MKTLIANPNEGTAAIPTIADQANCGRVRMKHKCQQEADQLGGDGVIEPSINLRNHTAHKLRCAGPRPMLSAAQRGQFWQSVGEAIGSARAVTPGEGRPVS